MVEETSLFVLDLPTGTKYNQKSSDCPGRKLSRGDLFVHLKDVESIFDSLGSTQESLQMLATYFEQVAQQSLEFCAHVATEFCPFLNVQEIHKFKMQPVCSWDYGAFGMTATVCRKSVNVGKR